MHYADDKESRQFAVAGAVFPSIWGGCAAILCLFWAFVGASQPLWVDELHSSWLLSAPDWQQLSARAAMGNQSPYYFYLIALLGWTVEFPPASPWVMRLPAMLAWSTSVGLCVWIVLAFPTSHQPECVSTRFQFSTRFLRQPDANAFRLMGQFVCKRLLTACGIYLPVILWAACIALDRNQGFYAVEARVYSLLQLLSLLAWLIVGRLVEGSPLTLPSPPQSRRRGDISREPLASQSRRRGDMSGEPLASQSRRRGGMSGEPPASQSPERGEAANDLLAQQGNAVKHVVDLARDPLSSVECGNSGEFHYVPQPAEIASQRCMLGRWVASRNRALLWFSWCLLCTCLIHLHVTSCLVVATQALVLCWQLGNRQARTSLLLSFGWIGLQLALVIFNLQPVWQRREQWTAFAGDASGQSMLQILNLVPLLVPLLVVWLIQRLINRLRQHTVPHRPWVTSRPWFWAVAWAGPWLIAALVTRLEIAPVFHYRFIIASALPLYLLIACALQQLTSIVLRTLAITAILLGLLWTQGSLMVWRQGGCYLGLRGENWAGAVSYVSENFQSDRHALWCYAGLIEGHNMQWPLTEKQDEYLSFPLRGWHQVAALNSKPVQPHGLTGQFEAWGDQIRIQSDSADAVWIVFRGSAGQLQQRLKQAKLDRYAQRHPIREFGRVSVVCIERPPVD